MKFCKYKRGVPTESCLCDRCENLRNAANSHDATCQLCAPIIVVLDALEYRTEVIDRLMKIQVEMSNVTLPTPRLLVETK